MRNLVSGNPQIRVTRWLSMMLLLYVLYRLLGYAFFPPQQPVKILHHTVGKSIAFSPDGSTLALGDWMTIRLLDYKTSSIRHTIHAHSAVVRLLQFSPDGALLVSADDPLDETFETCSVKLWDARHGTLRHSLRGHRRRVFSAAFSPDGIVLATGGGDRAVRLWDTRTGKLMHVLRGFQESSSGMVYSLAFSRDGKMLATGDLEGSVKLWQVRTGRLIRTLRHSEALNPQICLTLGFLPDRNAVAALTSDSLVRVWDLQSGGLTTSSAGPRGGQEGAVSADVRWFAVETWRSSLAENPYGRMVTRNARTGETGLDVGDRFGVLESVALSADGSLVAVGGAYNDEGGTVTIWKAH